MIGFHFKVYPRSILFLTSINFFVRLGRFYSFFLLLSGVFLIVAAAAPFWLLERVPSDEDTGPACGIFSSKFLLV